MEAQGQQNESQGEPLGGLCQLGVQRLGLALGQEGLRAAGDGAGEAGALPLCISTIAVTAMPERTWRTVRIMVMTDIYFNPFKVYRFNSHKSIT